MCFQMSWPDLDAEGKSSISIPTPESTGVSIQPWEMGSHLDGFIYPALSTWNFLAHRETYGSLTNRCSISMGIWGAVAHLPPPHPFRVN